MSKDKHVYKFGNRTAEGNAKMKNLLGGKGANLAEMNLIGVPVPAGFTITTEVCNDYFVKGRDATIDTIFAEVEDGVCYLEEVMEATFGSPEEPLLLSVRSGARASMPGSVIT